MMFYSNNCSRFSLLWDGRPEIIEFILLVDRILRILYMLRDLIGLILGNNYRRPMPLKEAWLA